MNDVDGMFYFIQLFLCPVSKSMKSNDNKKKKKMPYVPVQLQPIKTHLDFHQSQREKYNLRGHFQNRP